MPSFERRESELTSSFALTLQIQRIIARSFRRKRLSVAAGQFLVFSVCTYMRKLGKPLNIYIYIYIYNNTANDERDNKVKLCCCCCCLNNNYFMNPFLAGH